MNSRSQIDITSPLELPCGAVLNNRLAKAAMTERFSNGNMRPNSQHCNLYSYWAKGGAGLLITGNVMVEKKNVESAGNVVITRESLPELKRWANAATEYGNHCWVQISHSGRQTSIFNNLSPVSASDVKLKRLGFFAKPRPLTEPEIRSLIHKYALSAAICREAGFTGVQIHAAHGYLISQFLSPITNQRSDRWGGPVENRANFLFEIIGETRKQTGQDFPISVKINSSDFQKGGFTEDESEWVTKELAKLGIDLLEVSGGTYENAVFLLDENIRESTRLREAYFLTFAERIKQLITIPVMVTGGIRTLGFCNQVLKDGQADLLGIARPFLLYDNFASRFMKGSIEAKTGRVRTGWKSLEDLAEAGYYNLILERLGNGLPISTEFGPLRSALHLIKHEFTKAIENRLSNNS